MSKRVLIHGGDATLLETRRQILLRAGLAVDTTLNNSDVGILIDTVRPDLLIVCSSLPLDAKQSDIRTAHATRPELRCLIINPLGEAGFDTADTDTVFQPFDGPERFMREVQRLLET